MAEITWIKLTTNIFEDEKINFIESLPDADMLIVIWLKLLTMAGKINDGGFIYLTEKMPYTPEMLANKFNRPLNTIKLALKTFQELEMIELIENKIFISKWEKHQSIDEMAKIKEQTRQRVARHREKKQLECNVTVTLPVTQCNAIEENKKEKRIEYTTHTQDPFSHFKILGKRENVYLTDKHLNQLDCLIGSRNKVNELIDEVSDAIGLGKYAKWNCELEDAHCILVEKFYKHQKKNNTGIKLGNDSGLDLSKIDFK